MPAHTHRPAHKVPRVVLLIESSRSSGRNLLRGIADYARDRGPWAFYWQPRGLAEAQPTLRSLDANGIILRDVENIDEILGSGLPAVVVGHARSEIPGAVNVITDSDAIGTMAAEHLIGCGFRAFAYCGLENVPWSAPRGESFKRSIAAAGFRTEFYAADSRHPPGSKAERQHMARWLKSLPRPLGIMACNDDRGEQVIEACKIAGIHVPDEIGILGADNDDLVCDLTDPPMSSVAINFHRAGYECAEVLHRLMRRQFQPQAKIVVAPTQVVARRSTDIVAHEDPGLAAALRFIRDHSHHTITVPDVARAAGLSRRVLEKRFQRLMKRSTLSEIRRARVGQICRLLIETNQSVSEIAQTLQFPSTEHIARYFRREMRMAPVAYRRRFGRR